MDDTEMIIEKIEIGKDVSTMKLPDIDLYTHWNLYSKRILNIEDEITAWDYHIVKDIININFEDMGKPIDQRKPIIILINSCGGLLDITNSIIDAIQMSITPVYTVNVGNALSGGCLIFLAGEKRFTTNNSYCMAHAGRGGIFGNYSETVEQTKVWDEQVKNMGEYIVSRTGIDEKTWKKYKNKDWWMNADQQIEFGFATEKLENFEQLFGGI